MSFGSIVRCSRGHVVAPPELSRVQNALLSGRGLVPARHSARRSIVVPRLELAGLGLVLSAQHETLHHVPIT
jgi:hypothetical protein